MKCFLGRDDEFERREKERERKRKRERDRSTAKEDQWIQTEGPSE